MMQKELAIKARYHFLNSCRNCLIIKLLLQYLVILCACQHLLHCRQLCRLLLQMSLHLFFKPLQLLLLHLRIMQNTLNGGQLHPQLSINLNLLQNSYMLFGISAITVFILFHLQQSLFLIILDSPLGHLYLLCHLL